MKVPPYILSLSRLDQRIVGALWQHLSSNGESASKNPELVCVFVCMDLWCRSRAGSFLYSCTAPVENSLHTYSAELHTMPVCGYVEVWAHSSFLLSPPLPLSPSSLSYLFSFGRENATEKRDHSYVPILYKSVRTMNYKKLPRNSKILMCHNHASSRFVSFCQ